MKSPLNSRNIAATHQSGIVLFVALILLLILSLIGVTVARMQTVEERMARNDHNREMGAQSAEAGLRQAERGLLAGIYTNFAANDNGLYVPSATIGSVIPTLNWTSGTASIPYTGPALSAVPLAQPPRYVIESLPPVAVPGESIAAVQYASPAPPVAVYRISAMGVGADDSSSTIMQSILR